MYDNQRKSCGFLVIRSNKITRLMGKGKTGKHTTEEFVVGTSTIILLYCTYDYVVLYVLYAVFDLIIKNIIIKK